MADREQSNPSPVLPGIASGVGALGPVSRVVLLGLASGTASYLLGLFESGLQSSVTLSSPALCFAGALCVAFAERDSWSRWTYLWLVLAIFASWHAAVWIGTTIHREIPLDTGTATKMLVAGLGAGLTGASGTYLAIGLVRPAIHSIRATAVVLLVGTVLGGALLWMEQMGWLLFTVWQTGVLAALSWSEAARRAPNSVA